MSSRTGVEHLLSVLGFAYNRQSWHGPNLRGSIRGVDVEAASWRPGPQRHNIWEITVHAAYWKYAARRRLTGEKRGAFPLKGSNWFERPLEPTVAAWRSDLELLDREHSQLLGAVERLSDQDLGQSVGKGLVAFQLIQGIAFHDVYHAGQIRLLRKMQ